MPSRKIIIAFLISAVFCQQSFAQDVDSVDEQTKIHQSICVLHAIQEMIINGVDVLHQTQSLDKAQQAMLVTMQNFKDDHLPRSRVWLWAGDGGLVLSTGSAFALIKAEDFKLKIEDFYIPNLRTILGPMYSLMSSSERAATWAVVATENNVELFKFNASVTPTKTTQGFDQLVRIVESAAKDDRTMLREIIQYKQIYKQAQWLMLKQERSASVNRFIVTRERFFNAKAHPLFQEAERLGGNIDNWILQRTSDSMKEVSAKLFGTDVLVQVERNLAKAKEYLQPDFGRAVFYVNATKVGFAVGIAAIAFAVIYKNFFEKTPHQPMTETDVRSMDDNQLSVYLEDHMEDVEKIVKLDQFRCEESVKKHVPKD